MPLRGHVTHWHFPMPISSLSNYAAEAIDRWRTGLPADAALRDFMSRHPRFPQAGRTKLVRAVFAYFRWLRWLDESESLPAQIEAATAVQDRYERDPKNLKDQTLAARAVPEWVWAEVNFGEGAPAAARKFQWVRALQTTPPLWLRARLGTAAKVAATLGHCRPAPHPACPDALRYTGATDLFRTAAFNQGDFEIQDLASQLVGAACAPQPGETWWDACAGEGGKALHLADQMRNKGTVWCSDRSARRLENLKRRFSRAQLYNYRVAPWDGGPRLPTKAKFDGILVDAPCSGLGTWARNPDARWTTTPKDVAELAAVQLQLLTHVAGSLKPGGRLIYAVCTLTRSETTAVAAAFAAAHPELEPHALDTGSPKPGEARKVQDSASAIAAEVSQSSGVQDSANPHSVVRAPQFLTLWPQDLAANGMFLAAWRRR